MADRVGQEVGHYRLLRLLGRGGFADVYLGEHVHLSTLAAVKLLHTSLLNASEIERFRQEARIIAHLIHPNIVRVLDFDAQEGMPYLVMDYAPGGTLRQRHPPDTVVPLASVVSYVQQLAKGLSYAHQHQVVHRDVKPQNLLLGREGELLLSDFGISMVAESTSRQQTQGFAGTAAYAAPEQVQGHPRPASDHYALGMIVYEWLTGSLPFTGPLLEVMWRQAHTTPPPLREKVPTISSAVEEVVLTALAKDPKERFGSVQAFAAAFEEASLLDLPTQVVYPAAPLAPPPAGARLSTPPAPASEPQSTNLPSPAEPRPSGPAVPAATPPATPAPAGHLLPTTAVPPARRPAETPRSAWPPAPASASSSGSVTPPAQAPVGSRPVSVPPAPGGDDRKTGRRHWHRVLIALLVVVSLVGVSIIAACSSNHPNSQVQTNLTATPTVQPTSTPTPTPMATSTPPPTPPASVELFLSAPGIASTRQSVITIPSGTTVTLTVIPDHSLLPYQTYTMGIYATDPYGFSELQYCTYPNTATCSYVVAYSSSENTNYTKGQHTFRAFLGNIGGAILTNSNSITIIWS